LEEKNGFCYVAASGGPLVQHSLLAMIQLHKKGYFKIEKIVEKMCHSPADLFRIEKRGYLRKGYYADLVLIDINAPQQVEAKNCYSKCGWSPFEGIQFDARIKKTFVNGKIVYDNGIFNEEQKGKRLLFNL
jgi:dihydroorotase